MRLAPDVYGSSGGAVVARVPRDRELALSVDAPWQQALMRSMRVGSAGVVVLVTGYSPYLPRVGTSPAVVVVRGVPVPSPVAEDRPIRRQAARRMSSSDQVLEINAALNLNKTLLAEVLGVSRPTLYDWLEGKEPNPTNARRLTALVRLLANAGVTAADSLSPRFVREALNDGEPSLLDLLKADTINEARIAKVLKEAKALEDDAENMRLARDERLRAAGFDEVSPEQRKANLALNVALREWPKD